MSAGTLDGDDRLVPASDSCIRCGYALEGLLKAGDCPECGAAIQLSLAGDQIAGADPRWLDLIQLGLRLLHVGILVAAGSLGAFYSVLLIAILGGFLSIAWPAALDAAGGVLVFVPLGAAAAAVGGWLVTTAEPRDVDRERPQDARPVARAGPVLAVAFGVAAPILKSSLPAPHDLIAWFAAFIGVALAAGLGLAALAERLRQLTARVPSPDLANRFAKEAAWYRSQARLTVVALGIRLVAVVLSLTAPAIGRTILVQFIDSIATLAIMLVVLAAMIHVVRLAGRANELRTAVLETRGSDAPV